MTRWKQLKRETLAHSSKSSPSWWKPRQMILNATGPILSTIRKQREMDAHMLVESYLSLESVSFTVLTSHLSVINIISQRYLETHLSGDSVSVQLTVNTNHHRGFRKIVDEIILFVHPTSFLFLFNQSPEYWVYSHTLLWLAKLFCLKSFFYFKMGHLASFFLCLLFLLFFSLYFVLILFLSG